MGVKKQNRETNMGKMAETVEEMGRRIVFRVRKESVHFLSMVRDLVSDCSRREVSD